MTIEKVVPSADGDRARAIQERYRRTAGASVDAELVRLSLKQIGDRLAGDTRPLTQKQVEILIESISAIGLIQPLAVDAKGRLLAGGHRRAALQQLQEQDLPKFNDLFPGGIPCRQFTFDSEAEPEQALAVEISENEKRRNYTKTEIQAVAARLKERGYSQERGRGNKQPLIPALAIAFGVHRATIMRALSEEPNVAAATFDDRPAQRSLKLPADLVQRLEKLAKERQKSTAALTVELLEAGISNLVAQEQEA